MAIFLHSHNNELQLAEIDQKLTKSCTNNTIYLLKTLFLYPDLLSVVSIFYIEFFVFPQIWGMCQDI